LTWSEAPQALKKWERFDPAMNRGELSLDNVLLFVICTVPRSLVINALKSA